jgi:hypothetical protein
MKNKFMGSLVAVGVAAATLAGAEQAQAAVILSGNSNSSSFTNCVGTGCPAGSATSITLGSTAPGGSNSTLSILSVPFSASGAITGLELAGLQVSVGQKAGSGDGTLSFDYNLVLTFTLPSSSSTTQLDLSLSGNGSAGGNSGVTITGLTDPIAGSLNLAGGLSLSNFRFADVGSSGTFAGSTWTVTGQGNSATLELLADLSVTSQQEAAVPEPSSVALMATALGCLGLFLRKKQRQS